MKYAPIIHTADWHLDANPRNAYRWEIFAWLAKIVRQYEAKAIVIAGDLTDAKDNHPAELVNRVVEELTTLAKVAPIWILLGNHDYVDPDTPFFKFLGTISNVTFIYKPLYTEILGRKYLFLPHTRKWKEWRKMDRTSPDRIVIHQPIRGAITSTGQSVDGANPRGFQRFQKGNLVIAGDIHKPQQLGNIIYCGSPHPVSFGEDHDPRVLLDVGPRMKLQSVVRLTVRKVMVTLENPEDIMTAKFNEGDFVKVTMVLPRREFHRWKEVKKIIRKGCRRRRVRLSGIRIVEAVRSKKKATVEPFMAGRLLVARPSDVLTQFCKAKGITGELQEAGLRFVEG